MAFTSTDPTLDNMLRNVGDLTFRRRIVTILEFLQLRDNDYVLDAGCGEGFYVMLMTRLTKAKIAAIDGNDSLITTARQWVGKNDLVSWHVGDLIKLPFADKTFSKIICSEVLEHLPDPVATLRELRRVLRDDGVMAVTVPNHRYPLLFDPLNWVREHLGLGHFSSRNLWLGGLWANHVRLYTARELTRDLTAGGLDIQEMRALTRYCLPFQQLLLFAGKQMYTRLPVPESVRIGMEKFEYQKAGTTSSWHPAQLLVRAGLNLLRAVDRFNERSLPLHGTAMHLAAKVVKSQ